MKIKTSTTTTTIVTPTTVITTVTTTITMVTATVKYLSLQTFDTSYTVDIVESILLTTVATAATSSQVIKILPCILTK